MCYWGKTIETMTMIIDEIKLIQDWFGQQGETGVGGFEEKGVWRGYKIGRAHV